MASETNDTDGEQSSRDRSTARPIDNPSDREALERITTRNPSRLGVGRSGPRPRTETLLEFRSDHGLARDAVLTHVDEAVVDELGLLKIQSRVADKDEYLARPDLGRDVSEETVSRLRADCATSPQVQIVVSDGLSSTAVETNVPELLPVLLDGLADRGLDVGTPVFVEYGRVDVMDAIGEELDADCCVNLIGERPGLASAESLSAYMVYGPERGTPTSKKSVISNIHDGGLPPIEAGAQIADLVEEMCERECSGLELREDDREFQEAA
ncbi:ethanolamine ammonia-lyase subunit EutC [Natranaeroarchaeum sulfidigenes]|uniref:Putative ethanolamine ammonia-lyase small subunit n=1 Tax=Natranaeroarchaeum sulfidigenes TaxID=2784880 RepID=A0A897MZA2_9EURY|nr:ethanolamine ammonia-lyase subunit EutC [Natranaeroarchaeum sulfidigenes]QSG03705.1 Ethanolamine ammonia-lyase light chai [Natranaeroarchaeum sulfidigenes]